MPKAQITIPLDIPDVRVLQTSVSEGGEIIITIESTKAGTPNCITGNVTMRRIVASGKMLLSDRQISQSEEQHDEPEQQARVVRSCATTVPESQ